MSDPRLRYATVVVCNLIGYITNLNLLGVSEPSSTRVERRVNRVIDGFLSENITGGNDNPKLVTAAVGMKN